MNLLSSRGIDVHLYSVHNDSIKGLGPLGKMRAAIETTWSFTEYKKIKRFLIDMKPDVVHIHNFFPLISPSIYYACTSLKIPVVQTLHNYRIICPAATFLRDNKICELCLTGSIVNSIRHGCYHDSNVQTLPVSSMISVNKFIGTWNSKVNRYIALTNFAKSKFVESGISSDKVVIKPNFIQRKEIKQKNKDENYILFVGRISIEKGVHHLLEAWRSIQDKKNIKLIIIGDGPEKQQLASRYSMEDVIFLGKQNEEVVLQYMKNARYLVVPSIWYEGFPMTIVEAYSFGTPVICSSIGSLKEVVEDGITGFHFENNNSFQLGKVIEKALSYERYDQMCNKVFQKFNENYTAEINYKQLKGIYMDVIKENKDAILSRK
ncbi:glycosyl transferase [Niallia nealsonii]|uniref:Glycosyl transferase n=2 Tax=Niallia nealsonii TaxID=115979 RepID=A0A2N0Z2N2_9BACI|nr:glycosyl transferase [Niallia nealsonii]